MVTFFVVNLVFMPQVIEEYYNKLNYLILNSIKTLGNIKKVEKNENPTEYRAPFTYIDYFQSKTIEVNDQEYGYELVFARPSRTYIEVIKELLLTYFL